MSGFSIETRIDRPPAAVWAELTDLEHAPAWMPGIASIALDEDGPLRQGAVYRFRVDGLKAELQKGIVTRLQPQQELALSTSRGKVTATYTYRLSPDGGGTAVTLRADCAVSGWLRPLAPFLGFLMKRSDSGQLQALKQQLEGEETTRQNVLEANQESHSRPPGD